MLLRTYAWLQARLDREDGGVAAEYAILITLIALVVVAGATALGIAINNTLNDAATVSPLGP